MVISLDSGHLEGREDFLASELNPDQLNYLILIVDVPLLATWQSGERF